ncbi:hypothetical protein A2U01_0079026, partial [Trifolium medium]|nr:hypothetical protein [Trifolium medium]
YKLHQASEGADGDGKGSQTIDMIDPVTRLKLCAQSSGRKLL